MFTVIILTHGYSWVVAHSLLSGMMVRLSL